MTVEDFDPSASADDLQLYQGDPGREFSNTYERGVDYDQDWGSDFWCSKLVVSPSSTGQNIVFL